MALISTAMTEILSALARFGLAGVWLYSGIVKLLNPVESRQAIQAYELLPDNAVGLVAVGLPTLEVILGLLLLLGVFLRPVAIISGIIIAVFIAGLLSAWARGLQIDCGCFGGGGYNPEAGTRTYLISLGRDVIFLAFAAVVAWRPFRRFAIYP